MRLERRAEELKNGAWPQAYWKGQLIQDKADPCAVSVVRGLDRPKEARVAESNNYGCRSEGAGGRSGEAVASQRRWT